MREYLQAAGISEERIILASQQGEGGIESLFERIGAAGEFPEWVARNYGINVHTGERISGWESPDPMGQMQEPEAEQMSAGGDGTLAVPFQPQNEQDFNQVPSGAYYLNPADGRVYRKN